MKHLKQFESFGSGIKELDWVEWDEVMSHRDDKFTSNEISKMIEVIINTGEITKTEMVQNFGKLVTPRILQLRQYKSIEPTTKDGYDKKILKHLELYKKSKDGDPDWFYIHLEDYEGVSANYYECDTFEDFIEKLEGILLEVN
jgi:hypothetical protein